MYDTEMIRYSWSKHSSVLLSFADMIYEFKNCTEHTEHYHDHIQKSKTPALAHCSLSHDYLMSA